MLPRLLLRALHDFQKVMGDRKASSRIVMLPWNISFMHGEGLDIIPHRLTDVACGHSQWQALCPEASGGLGNWLIQKPSVHEASQAVGALIHRLVRVPWSQLTKRDGWTAIRDTWSFIILQRHGDHILHLKPRAPAIPLVRVTTSDVT